MCVYVVTLGRPVVRAVLWRIHSQGQNQLGLYLDLSVSSSLSAWPLGALLLPAHMSIGKQASRGRTGLGGMASWLPHVGHMVLLSSGLRENWIKMCQGQWLPV